MAAFLWSLSFTAFVSDSSNFCDLFNQILSFDFFSSSRVSLTLSSALKKCFYERLHPWYYFFMICSSTYWSLCVDIIGTFSCIFSCSFIVFNELICLFRYLLTVFEVFSLSGRNFIEVKFIYGLKVSSFHGGWVGKWANWVCSLFLFFLLCGLPKPTSALFLSIAESKKRMFLRVVFCISWTLSVIVSVNGDIEVSFYWLKIENASENLVLDIVST